MSTTTLKVGLQIGRCSTNVMTIKTYFVRSTAAVDSINYLEKGFPLKKSGLDNFFTPKHLNLKSDSCIISQISEGWCPFASGAARDTVPTDHLDGENPRNQVGTETPNPHTRLRSEVRFKPGSTEVKGREKKKTLGQLDP